MSHRRSTTLFGRARTARSSIKLELETLEMRTVMSSGAVQHALALPQLTHSNQSAAIQTLSGRITNDSTSRAMANVGVQLVNENGAVVKTTHTNRFGFYQFKVNTTGAYVIREVTPRGFIQTSPKFVSTAPVGAFGTGFGPSNFNYRTGNNDPTLGPVGPAAWSTIAPAGNLPFESPVNITGPSIDLSPVLSINFKGTAPPKAITNTGAQLQVQFDPSSGNTLTLGGQVFNLLQFHYHDPSENHVNGVTFPMEEHFVATSASGAETVVAVFLQLGAHNTALDPILNAATSSLTTAKSTTTISTPINFAGLLPSNLQGWYYQGSLTTPPLSQSLNWLVLATPITLDHAQLLQYEAVANGTGFLPSARPIQPTDGRQFNEVDYDINAQGQSLSGLNFSLARANTVLVQTSLGSSKALNNKSFLTNTTTTAMVA